MLRRLFIFLFYCLFSLSVIAVCLVLLFPRQQLLSWSAQLVERKFPGVECSIAEIRYVHPLKIRLYDVRVKYDRHQFELPIDTLLVSFAPRYPVERIGIVGVLLGGSLRVDVNLDKADRIEFENLEFSGMQLADLKMLERNIDRPVQGLFSMNGRAAIDRRKPADIRFNGTVAIEAFRTRLRRPLFKETEVRFDVVTSDVTVMGSRLELSVGRAAGPLLAGDFNGQVQGHGSVGQSTLDIVGSVMPGPDLLEMHPELSDQLDAFYQRYGRKSIPYVIDGTIGEPEFRFSDPN